MIVYSHFMLEYAPMRLPVEFDLHTLDIFLLVVESGSMTQCASRMNVTQSAVSQAIARLENSIGTPLFDRTLRPLAMTVAGKALYERSQNLLAYAKTAYDDVREGARMPIDHVTIGMSESLATQFTVPLLSEMQHRVNHWTLHSGISAKQHDDFLARRYDMLITGSNLLEQMPGIDHHLVVEDPFVIILPREYRGPTDLADMGALPFIRYALDTGMGQRIERQIVRMKLHLPNKIEIDVTHQQLTAVAHGLGWSITSALCLAAQPQLIDQLRIEPLARGAFSRRVHVVARAGDLGTLPEEMATITKRVLHEKTFPPLLGALPWLEPLLNRASDLPPR